MPIDIGRFEGADALRERPTSDRILAFLLEHADSAYTRSEIADAIDAKPETVGTNLTRLKERGLVRHREPYWAITEDHAQARDTLQAQADAGVGVTNHSKENTNHGTAETDQTDQGTPSSEIDSNPTAESDPDAPASVASSVTEHSPQAHREAAETFIDRVRDRLDTAIDALYLFGSVARTDATTESDVDILAVIAEDADYATVDDQLLELAYDIQLKFGVTVEVHSLQASEFAARRDRGDPFIQTVLEEGTACV